MVLSRQARLLVGTLVVWLLVGLSCQDRVLAVTIEGGDVVLAVGQTHSLTADVVATGKATRDVTWASDRPEVATVTSGGLVTAIAEGVAEVSATSTFDDTKSASLQVTVTAATQTLSVTIAGTGAGRVTSTPTGLDCPTTCSAAFPYGTSVSLTATASTDSLFAGWGGACSGSAACAVNLTANASVTATFDSTIGSNDNFAQRFSVSGDRGTTTGSNVDATKEPGEPDHAGEAGGRSVWWSWTATTDGLVTFDTIGSDFDTLLAVYTGSAVDALTLVAENDDASYWELYSRVQFTTTAGVTYQIAVDGYEGDSGAIVLNWAPGPVNNDFANRADAYPGYSPATGTNTGATKEPDEPDHAGNAGGRSVWWSWTSPSDGRVSFDTFGSDFDTLLAVYTGSAVNALTLVASDDDYLFAPTSRVEFEATAGTTYAIAVDGKDGASGAIVLNWSPANDMFWRRFELSGSSGTTTGFNHDATSESGEPNHAGRVGGRSVWWSWTAPSTGPMVVHTLGSDIDTLLAIYTGSSPDTLTPIATNDDAGPGYHSRVDFAATEGVSYEIAVDAFGGYGGDIVLNWGPGVSNDDFERAWHLWDETGTVTASNVGATKEAGEPDHAGAPGGRSVWFAWQAPSSGEYAFDTFGSGIDTLLAVYTGGSVDALTEVVSNDDAGGGTQSRVQFVAIAGVTYRIAVDGFFAFSTGRVVLNWAPAP